MPRTFNAARDERGRLHARTSSTHTRILPPSPPSRRSFKVGDRIIAINGQSLEERGVNEVMGGEKDDVLSEQSRKKSYVFKIERVKSTRSISRGRSRDRIEPSPAAPAPAAQAPTSPALAKVSDTISEGWDTLTKAPLRFIDSTIGTNISANPCAAPPHPIIPTAPPPSPTRAAHPCTGGR